jgi:glucose-6-phosphate dehydrogenase assembly protein OpcA
MNFSLAMAERGGDYETNRTTRHPEGSRGVPPRKLYRNMAGSLDVARDDLGFVKMPDTAETISLGLPVAIDRIDRELKKLWSEGEGAMTRASLMNLAVYSEEPESLTRNTRLLARITENHACRAIVIGADPGTKDDRMEAWISAHCHLSRAGTKRVCSEQISFLLEGTMVKLLPSIVFSQLDSDLPLYLWWQAEFAEPMDPQLWSWIDRLIYDSQSWRDFNAQMRLVETAQREAKQRIVLCDLNWTRLVHFRLAFAQFFDHPSSHHHFGEIEGGSIIFGNGFRSTAILFVGWLAAQLGWEIRSGKNAEPIELENSDGKMVRLQLEEKGDAPIASFTVESQEIEFQVTQADCGDLLEVCRGKLSEDPARQVLPSSENDPVKLMSEELVRGGPHHVYLRAVEKVRSLL